MRIEVPQTHRQFCKCKLKLPYCITLFLDISLGNNLDWDLQKKKKESEIIRQK